MTKQIKHYCNVCEADITDPTKVGMDYELSTLVDIKFKLCYECAVIVLERTFKPYDTQHLMALLASANLLKRGIRLNRRAQAYMEEGK